MEGIPVQPEHGAVEEAERAAVLVQARARQLALAQQVQQVLPDLLGLQRIGAAGVVARQARDGVDVGLTGTRGMAAQLERIEHALTKRCHHLLPVEARAHARGIESGER